jgi:hypothetical protein
MVAVETEEEGEEMMRGKSRYFEGEVASFSA